MQIFSLLVGALEVNCYIIADPRSREAIVIDPGDNADEILDLIQTKSLNVKYILNTHGHIDHIGANTALRKALHAPIAIHHADANLLRNATLNGAALFGFPFTEHSPDLLLNDNDAIESPHLKLTLLHTPGHSPGSACFLAKDCIFTGDTLFAGSVGRTDLLGGDPRQLSRSLKNKILPLPDSLTVYCGHGAITTIAAERRSNPFLTDLQ
jgi:hydroxyacylglutathione hydrolase